MSARAAAPGRLTGLASRTAMREDVMTARKLLALLTPLMILVLACGPAAAPDSGAPVTEPLAQADTTTQAPKPTPTPDPYPAKPPLPSEPRPTLTPVPEHPEGLEGCKSVAIFKYEADVEHHGWCEEQLTQHVGTTCQQEPTEAEQRQCGEDIVQEYHSVLFRYGRPSTTTTGYLVG